MNPLRALFLSLSRMPPAVMLLIIVGLAVVVTMMVTNQMSQKDREASEHEAQLKAKYEQKGKVVRATKEIAEGTAIQADALEEVDIESSKVPVDALSSQAMAVGQIAKYNVQQGSVLCSHDLTTKAVGTIGFEQSIQKGRRAVTFGVDATSGVAGFVAPGSHVDILATVGSGATTKAAPILSNVEVVAVGSIYQKAGGTTAATNASTVTVSVAPEEANKLVKAMNAGKLYLTLRTEKDNDPVAVVDVTSLFAAPPAPKDTNTAFAPPAPAPLPPPPPPPSMGGGGAEKAPPSLHEIEVWSGSKREIQSVPKL